MASGARAVRIVRSREPRTGATALPREEPGDFRPNSGGMRRAVRLFELYVVGLAALLGAFALIFSQEGGGIRPNLGALGVFALLAAFLGGYGALVTVGRAPKGVWGGAEEFIVAERFGTKRTFSRDALARRVVSQHHGAGFLSTVPTEMVGLRDEKGTTRYYLVDAGLFPAE